MAKGGMFKVPEEIVNMDQRVLRLEDRVESMERNFEKMDANLQALREQINQHREGQVRTQTLVEVVGKDVSELKVQIAKNTEAQQTILQALNEHKQSSTGKWERFWNKAFWGLAGALVSYLIYRTSH
ncbi:hypothetical protein DNHGIG_07900 [Collibacillus ludicampi]|uniref:DUF1640 domain-containing protein n=2 Tax=Collibacillus ludicampi TaxID=2771369 RepID=A0AAV4LBX1_9BACL|nr:hypothetical protein DNHGIG_07900 [Collibacillus ludicampi]